jgi:hypothetical protein
MYKFLGRVRLSDGATVLLKAPVCCRQQIDITSCLLTHSKVDSDLDGEGSALMRGIGEVCPVE